MNEAKECWGYASSPQPERWTGCDSRDEAIEEGRSTYEGETFWIVQGDPLDPADMMPAPEWILDDAGERAYETAGESAEDWPPNVPKESLDELKLLLATWARKHMPIKFWLAAGDAERIDPEEPNGPAPDGKATP